MKIISTKVHGVLDYLMGLVLIASPWIFNFADGGPAQTVPAVLGVIMIVASALTNYELGAIRKIPMKTHLTLDVLMGLFLAASPWIFGFSESVFLPHLVLGIAEVGAGLMTDSVPFRNTHAPASTNQVGSSAGSPGHTNVDQDQEPHQPGTGTGTGI